MMSYMYASQCDLFSNLLFFRQDSRVSGKKSSKRKLGKIFERDSKVCNGVVFTVYC